MKRPALVGDLVSGLLQGTPMEKRLEEGKIWLAWDAVVGAQIAGQARPVSFREGVLTVAVASAPWMQQLAFLKPAMQQKLNDRLGYTLVTDIYLKAGTRKPAASMPAPREKKAPVLTDEDRHRAARQAADITDPELRAAFASLLEKHLADPSSR